MRMMQFISPNLISSMFGPQQVLFGLRTWNSREEIFKKRKTQPAKHYNSLNKANNEEQRLEPTLPLASAHHGSAETSRSAIPPLPQCGARLLQQKWILQASYQCFVTPHPCSSRQRRIPQASGVREISLDEITTKSGIRPLMTLSKEAMGSIYLDMEQYPRALEKFQEARAIADGPTANAYQSMYCAEVLWRLGRYSESDEMLLSVPPGDKFKNQMVEIRLDSLLSRMKYREVDTLAKDVLANSPGMAPEDKQQLELDQAIAKSHLRMKPEEFQRLSLLSGDGSRLDPWTRLGSKDLQKRTYP